MGEEETASSAVGLAHSLHRASQRFDDRFATAMGNDDLTPRQLVVLELVSLMNNPSQTQICARSRIDRSTIADMVRRLVKKGYLGRRRSRTDARRYAVQLTDQGRSALERGLQVAREVEDGVMAALSDKQRKGLLAAIQRLADSG